MHAVATLVALSALASRRSRNPRRPRPPRPPAAAARAIQRSAAQKPKGPAPRLPNGKPDFSGVWQGGGPVGDIKDGLLPGEEIVMLPEAEKLMKSRLAADDPEARCLPTGVPRVAPYPWRILQTPRTATRRFCSSCSRATSTATGRSSWTAAGIRTISKRRGTATRSATGKATRSWSRRSASTTSSGSTSRAIRTRRSCSTVERYTRTDAGTLENVITINDPGAYAKPFTVKFTATLRPGWDLMEYICNENNQDVEHLKGPAGL